jgi:hypothetical protein
MTNVGIPNDQTAIKGESWSGDLWGGFAAMLVALPSSIAYGVAIYALLGADYVGQGVRAGILGRLPSASSRRCWAERRD